MPIRLRLTLWFTLVLTGILILSGIVTYSLTRRYLSSGIDDNLVLFTARVHGTLHANQLSGPLDYNVIHSNLPSVSDFSSPGAYIQFVDKDGVVVVKSDNLAGQELPFDSALIEKALAGEVGLETMAATDDSLMRVMVSPMYLQDNTLVLEVGQSLQTMDLALNRVRLALLAGVLAALLLSVLLGYIIVRKTLSPVRQVTRTARSIEQSSDLSQKVGYEGPQDEIGELASTFDRMIEKLDRAFKSQGRFIADASHELRTPLTVIKGNLGLLKRNLNDSDRKESVSAIDEEVARMATIVDDLLLLAEVEGVHPMPRGKVSLEQVLMEGFARARQLGGKRKVVLGRHDNLSIEADIHRVRQIVGNLIDNAVKYTPEEGTITLSLARGGEWARLDVADTGPGIAPEHLEHIFERFYRVDKARSRSQGGSGLGLAIVKQSAESIGAHVTLVSESGKGSTFTVWFKLP